MVIQLCNHCRYYLFLAMDMNHEELLFAHSPYFGVFRLGIYLSFRVCAHISEEEGRYKQLRDEWKENLT